ncbi:hypothetical protein ACFVH6_37555 [Spirillospora sp. NPDC127200]
MTRQVLVFEAGTARSTQREAGPPADGAGQAVDDGPPYLLDGRGRSLLTRFVPFGGGGEVEIPCGGTSSRPCYATPAHRP